MNRIKELRKKAGLSQRQLASQLGLGATAVCQYESEKRHPKKEILEKLADYFGVSAYYLQGLNTVHMNSWICTQCKTKFWATKLPRFCPYCKSKNIDHTGSTDAIVPGGEAK